MRWCATVDRIQSVFNVQCQRDGELQGNRGNSSMEGAWMDAYS